MKMNEGNVDRAFRVALGVAVLCLGYVFSNPWGLLGLIPFATGFIGWCPLYQLVGLKTR